MSYRDLSAAALYGLYGELSVRSHPGGEDRINDLAQAWIDGNRAPALEAADEHKKRLRAMPSTLSKRERIIALRLKGYRNCDIVRKVGCTNTYVAIVCKNMKLPRSPRKADPQRIIQLRNQGLKLRQIAEKIGISLWTAHRVLKRHGLSSVRSVTK